MVKLPKIRLKRPTRSSIALLVALIGFLLLAIGAALIYFPAGVLVAGAATAYTGLALIDIPEGARESSSARPQWPT